MIKNLMLSFKVGQKLLSFDTYQSNERVKVDPGIDLSKMKKSEKEKLGKLLQELASKINTDALRNGDTTAFVNSARQVIKELKPISDLIFNERIPQILGEIESLKLLDNITSRIPYSENYRLDFSSTDFWYDYIRLLEKEFAHLNWIPGTQPKYYLRIKHIGDRWIITYNFGYGEKQIHPIKYNKYIGLNYLAFLSKNTNPQKTIKTVDLNNIIQKWVKKNTDKTKTKSGSHLLYDQIKGNIKVFIKRNIFDEKEQEIFIQLLKFNLIITKDYSFFDSKGILKCKVEDKGMEAIAAETS